MVPTYTLGLSILFASTNRAKPYIKVCALYTNTLPIQIIFDHLFTD